MTKLRNWILVAAVMVLSRQAQALPVVNPPLVTNYPGVFAGTTVDYLSIRESNNHNTALFGAPSVSGNVLDFDPATFIAQSAGAADITDGQLNFTVMSKNNSGPITQLVFDEAGDFTLAGLGPALAEATVGMHVKINVVEVNGVPNFIGGPQLNMTFTPVGAGVPNPNGGYYVLPTDKGTAVPWSGHLVYNIAAIHPNATKVEVVLDNTLTAAAANGGSARIAKKDFSGLTVSLPEPSSGFLALALTLVGSGLVRRRGGIA